MFAMEATDGKEYEMHRKGFESMDTKIRTVWDTGLGVRPRAKGAILPPKSPPEKPADPASVTSLTKWQERTQ